MRGSTILALSLSVGACLSVDDDPGPPPVDLGVDVDVVSDVAGDGSGEPVIDEAALILDIEETGAFEVDGLAAEVHIVRTEVDVPHIYASNTHDLYFAAGFVMARDRYIEFELGSRLSLGTLSELLGDLTLGVDMESRGIGTAYVADRLLDGIGPEGLAALEAYAAGINAWLDALRDDLVPAPTELTLLGSLAGAANPVDVLQPATTRSVAGFAAYVVYVSSHGFEDLARTEVADRVFDHFSDDVALYDLRAAGLVEDIWRPVDPVFEVPATPGFRGDEQKGIRIPGVGAPVRLESTMLSRLAERGLARAAALGRGDLGDHGSNVWAMNTPGEPERGTVVAGDGHLSLGIPPIFMQMGLDDVVFGDGELRQTGLFLPGFPALGVGTNGHIAWSQTYPRADLTDFYAEEIELDDGVPARSFFDGEWRDLIEVVETYAIAGSLGSDAAELDASRWTTFDGRWLVAVEGELLEEASPDAISILGDWVVPGDVDGDGVISGISMDYTGFDIGDLFSSVDGLGRAQNVEEFAEATRGFVGYAQNLGVGDRDGSIYLTSYTATPCRDYLERDAEGEWVEGAHPNRVLDGTRYGGFTVELDDQGYPVEGHEDPYRCVIPFDAWPTAHNPASGFIMNANQDPGGLSFSGTLADERWHIGGPWVPGFRANTIAESLRNAAPTVESMARIQGDHTSPMGLLLAPFLIDTIELVASWAVDPGGTPAQLRAVDLYQANAPALVEVGERLSEWLDRGAPASSGVETFYDSPGEAEREQAVATMIFNAWFRQFLADVLGDEDVFFTFEPAGWGRTVVSATMQRLIENRGENVDGLASWNPATGESAFFDVLGTEEVEIAEEVALASLIRVLEDLAAEPRRAGVGGFGTDDMDQWLWGLRHQVKFESILAGVAGDNPLIDLIAGDFSISTDRLPLADSFDNDDPRRGLEWFPRPGDLFGVDAANPAFTGADFHYANGPVMRMVIRLGEDGVTGQNIIPGGQSGIVASEHFADQAALWLANETVPLRHTPTQVAEGAVGREVLTPR